MKGRTLNIHKSIKLKYNVKKQLQKIKGVEIHESIW